MVKIHRKVEYSLIALKHMSELKPGQLTSAKEIAEVYGIPFDTVSRVLQQMAQHGLLHSEQGTLGGYHILKDLSKITFMELMTIVLGPMVYAKCFVKEKSKCKLTPYCQIMPGVVYLNRKIQELFSSMTVEELMVAKSAEVKRIRLNYLSLQEQPIG